MRGVSRRILRGAAALVLLSALTSGAFAAPRDGGEDGWRARFHRFARFIVTIADELGMPPG